MLKLKRFNISSFTLHVLAMRLMLCDHAWAVLFPAEEWLTCIGRIAYPIFAFMIVEGCTHTHDLRAICCGSFCGPACLKYRLI